ncbi:hypothetical protein NP233_g8838 [Leucocoprinus birnbaumii]|uniref:Uncharacterized protein n=1 Tax=Leucocoprinus birnbaumii TaxID=56174 RepID=A0AAD5YMS4_9AGAR|nr:hypothetical protein NP233_g8838 [Leucocoprinus birnbaumii]
MVDTSNFGTEGAGGAGTANNARGQDIQTPAPGARNPTLLEYFRNLDLEGKLEWNKAREDRNRQRRAIQSANLLNPDAPEAVSDNESLFSLDEEDLKLLEDASMFKSLEDQVLLLTKAELAKRSKQKRVAEQVQKGSDEVKLTEKRHCVDGWLLCTRTNTSTSAPIDIPETYFQTQDEGVIIPLCLFHPSAIEYVSENLVTVDLAKINPKLGQTKKRKVMNVNKLAVIFGPDNAPSFTYDKYLKAVGHYLRFQILRDAENPDGIPTKADGPWSRTWHSHFAFFSSKTDASRLYSVWRSHELHLRRQILVKKMAYEEATYQQHYLMAQCNTQALGAASITQQLTFPGPQTFTMYQSFQPYQQFQPYAYPYQQSFLPSTPIAPQPSSSTGPPQGRKVTPGHCGGRSPSSPRDPRNNPTCVSCGGRHTIFEHLKRSFPDKTAKGKPTFCKTTELKLVTSDGKEVWILYNLASSTSKTCDHGAERSHICSACGGSHPALGGECKQLTVG